MKFTFKNTPIYYSSSGSGPALVLLHGFLESSTMWKNYIASLSENHTVVTLDFPGHGKSGVISEMHTMELMAEIVHALMHELKIGSATLVGHSMGGYVALAFTELYEHKVEKLLLINSTPVADSEDRKQNRKRALRVIDYNAEAFISMAITNLFPEGSQKKYSLEIEQLKKEAFQFPVDGIKAAIKGMINRKDRTDVLANFSRKKLLVSGTQDPIMPFSESKIISEKTNSELIKLPSGHMSWIENEREIDKILHFIE